MPDYAHRKRVKTYGNGAPLTVLAHRRGSRRMVLLPFLDVRVLALGCRRVHRGAWVRPGMGLERFGLLLVSHLRSSSAPSRADAGAGCVVLCRPLYSLSSAGVRAGNDLTPQRTA